MNSWDLVNKYSARLGVSQPVGSKYLDTLLDVVKEALLEEDSVILKGIGKLVPKELAPRRGVTPKGKVHSQPARLTIRIVPSGFFKLKLNQNRRTD